MHKQTLKKKLYRKLSLESQISTIIKIQIVFMIIIENSTKFNMRGVFRK